jgi:hypothetical protein
MDKDFTRDTPIFSSERMLHKDYDRNGSVEKNLWSWFSRGLTPRWADWREIASLKVILTLNLTAMRGRNAIQICCHFEVRTQFEGVWQKKMSWAEYLDLR